MTKILLIDDSASNRMVLGSLLEDEGIEVEEADSVAQAREKLCAKGAFYDVVMLDQHLGDGLGTSIVPVVRAQIPGARVMMISGSGEEEMPPDVVFDAMVNKGRDFDDVMVLVRKLLAEPRRT
jgi:DNA-binding NtrC family response regulator